MENSTAPNDISDSDISNSLGDTTDAEELAAIEAEQKATPLRCFAGALTSAGFSLLAYRLTVAIATSFANKPITSDNPIAVNISAAVRTLVMGMAALGAGVFGVAALGLAALGVQLLFKKDAVEKDTVGES